MRVSWLHVLLSKFLGTLVGVFLVSPWLKKHLQVPEDKLLQRPLTEGMYIQELAPALSLLG